MRVRAIIYEPHGEMQDFLRELLEARGYEAVATQDPLAWPMIGCEECRCAPGTACADLLIARAEARHAAGLRLIEQRVKRGCLIKNFALFSECWTAEERLMAQAAGCFVLNLPFPLRELEGWLTQCEEQIDPQRKLRALPTEIA